MAGVPYTFSTASQSIPLAQLDSNFATPITLGTSTAQLGQTVTTITGLTLANVNITGGTTNINASQILYTQGSDNSVTRTVTNKLQESVSVKDFGAIGDGTTDDTTAFQNAQGNGSVQVIIPPGTYKLNGLRIKNGVRLVGQGKNVVTIIQSTTGTPAINCSSDITVGQLKNLELSGFTVIGAANASVTAVLVQALGVYAIWNSTFDYSASTTYRSLEIQGPTAANVFQCKFVLESNNTSNIAVLINGCVYSQFDLFLTTCQTYALQDNSTDCVFTRLISDGAWTSNSQNNVYINPTIEEINATSVANATGISLTGFNQTLINPVINLSSASSSKLTYAIAPFYGTTIINPQFLCTTALLNPFASSSSQRWTLIGSGRNQCANKMETVYNNSSANADLRKITMGGDVSQFCNNATVIAGKTTQYAALATGAYINYAINSQTDMMIFDQAGTSIFINVTIGYSGYVPSTGQTLEVFANAAITTLSWSAGSTNVSLIPTTMTAGQTIRFVYENTSNKWYPC
jgi:hypothetical protein